MSEPPPFTSTEAGSSDRLTPRTRTDIVRIRLDTRWTNELLKLPESGMGYQRVDVHFRNGQKLEDIAVFNAEEIDLPDEFAQVEIVDLRLRA